MALKAVKPVLLITLVTVVIPKLTRDDGVPPSRVLRKATMVYPAGEFLTADLDHVIEN